MDREKLARELQAAAMGVPVEQIVRASQYDLSRANHLLRHYDLTPKPEPDPVEELAKSLARISKMANVMYVGPVRLYSDHILTNIEHITALARRWRERQG